MLTVLSSIVFITYLISVIARGYVPNFNNGLKITATGLLSANSIPKNASVIINEKLYTTTDSTVNLVPGDYQLKIIKDGYLPWNKKINIQQEMVYQAEASLFKSNPILLPIVSQKIINPTQNPDLTQIVFIIATPSAEFKSGIYLIETNYLSLVLNRYQPKFITQNPFSSSDNTISYTFSPNSKQLILKSSLKKISYLIDLTTSLISQPNEKTDLDWIQQSKLITISNLNKLPKIFTSTIATNPASIFFSSDENKFMYSLQDKYYVFDVEKNLNYLIGKYSDIGSPFWLPKSNSIIYTDQNKIKSIEFDGTNNNTLYSSEQPIKTLIPEYNGEKIIIYTATKSSEPLYIYSLTIK
ncbi:MAG: PEGA domain-containing protein [Candidatus Shapirobacteria bacterium]